MSGMMKMKVLTFVGREYMVRPGPKGEPEARVSPTVAELEVLEAEARTARRIVRLSPLAYLVME
jgi:hypothetical protein